MSVFNKIYIYLMHSKYCLVEVSVYCVNYCHPDGGKGMKKICFLKIFFAPAGVAQWIECWPENQRVTSSIPSQGTCLGCGSGPQ